MNKEILNWETHEDHVAAIYRLLGYRVTSNINITGQQTDLLCEKMIPGAGRTVLYIDCKYSDDKNTISKDTVNQFISNFHALKSNHGWTAGVLVTNSRYSQYAKSAAAGHHDIVLKTVNDLYADLFQIQSYLHRCIDEYEADETFTDYIPLNAIEQEGEASENVQKLGRLFDEWMAQPKNNQLCLLGDFGAGKTTFMQQIHYKCAREFLAGASVRMPLYIQLRDYFEVRDGIELIERFCSLELSTRVPHRLFDEFTRAGRFLLLLDGFDEMGVISDTESRRRNYLKLNQLMRSQSKVVITCRPAYFVTHEELLDVFGLYKRQMGLLPPPTRGDRKRIKPYSELSTELKAVSRSEEIKELLAAVGSMQRTSTIARLELFNESQIKAYLKIQRRKIVEESGGQLDDKSLLTRMKEIYDLEDLASRPILLKLIVNTLPLFKKNSEGKYTVRSSTRTFDDITPTVLYYVYTEGELTREYEKGELRWQVNRDERLRIIGELAFTMFESDSPILELKAFSVLVGHFFPGAGSDVDKYATDIRTCSFLTLDRSGYLRFTHKSLLEYFVSQHLISLFRSTRKTGELLGGRLLPSEIYYFLGDLVRSFYPSLLSVLHEVATSNNSVRKCNALNLLNHAGHPRPFVTDLKAETLIYVKLEIPILEFRHSYIRVVRWARCKIDQMRMEKATIEKLIVHGCDLRQLTIWDSEIELLDCAASKLVLRASKSRIKLLQLTAAAIERSMFSDCTVVFGRCHSLQFNLTHFRNTLFLSTDSTHILTSKMHQVVFDNCVFLYVRFDNDFLAAAEFRSCIFVRCYLNNGLELERLKGSRGFFQYGEATQSRAKSIEIDGQPYLWNAQRAEKVSITRPALNPRHAQGSTGKSKKRTEKLSWEDALAVTFSPKRPSDVGDWTIDALRKKLNQVDQLIRDHTN